MRWPMMLREELLFARICFLNSSSPIIFISESEITSFRLPGRHFTKSIILSPHRSQVTRKDLSFQETESSKPVKGDTGTICLLITSNVIQLSAFKNGRESRTSIRQGLSGVGTQQDLPSKVLWLHSTVSTNISQLHSVFTFCKGHFPLDPFMVEDSSRPNVFDGHSSFHESPSENRRREHLQ